MIDNIFDAPIPGQSLTDTPGNANWEHPPQFVDVDEAAEHIWDRLHTEAVLDQIITLLRNGVQVEAIVRLILFTGFSEGKWTPDVAILLAEIVLKQIMAIGVKAEIPKMKIFLKDQGNNNFHNNFAKFKIQKQKGLKFSGQDKEKKEKFLKDIKQELKESPGLMTKETE